MAFNIKLDSPIVDYKIGDKTFTADVSDEKVEEFSQRVLNLEKEMIDKEKEIKSDDEFITFVVDKTKEALGVIFIEENPTDYILEKTGRFMRLFNVLLDIKMEIEKESVESIQNKVTKYTRKPVKK